ncbi:nitrate reductase molybdenum cofactor assembly chaperone [Allorhizocola rhizosphaerae]|uniref:nitrate reductase molybdenum cofactor assembly chaperone n=1 Tax=Allorhizocola rhizosphaerae TaxID=1872709 RepID=UPI000E3CD163|nr:nitrate reductase molybdenum cofactor assembly chaperone [Allorhizocola rhizosphaerae]
MSRVLHKAASIALSYPESRAVLWGVLPEFESYLERTPLSVAQAHYVETFDMRKRCCLYLTYYTHGDTRRRGVALLKFRQAYQRAGLVVTDEELPDHLAVVLEFSAAGNYDAAMELLVAHRAGLELLWQALDGLGSPYASVVGAVRAALPRPGPADLAAARALAQEGPPVEMVGI